MADIKNVVVPDIGGFKGVEVIEVLVKAGDTVSAEQALITLETDKASMEVPAPFAGVVKELKVKLGDKVSEGDLILLLEASGGAQAAAAPAAPAHKAAAPAPAAAAPAPAPVVAAAPQAATVTAPAGKAHASPSIRRFARE